MSRAHDTRLATPDQLDEGITAHRHLRLMVPRVPFCCHRPSNRRQEVRMSHTVQGIKNVVLVHGGFVDGSGWQGVYDRLTQDGYSVSVVQHSTVSLAGDVAAVKRELAAQDGPAILVGHSYGGAVITEAGTDPRVA